MSHLSVFCSAAAVLPSESFAVDRQTLKTLVWINYAVSWAGLGLAQYSCHLIVRFSDKSLRYCFFCHRLHLMASYIPCYLFLVMKSLTHPGPWSTTTGYRNCSELDFDYQYRAGDHCSILKCLVAFTMTWECRGSGLSLHLPRISHSSV